MTPGPLGTTANRENPGRLQRGHDCDITNVWKTGIYQRIGTGSEDWDGFWFDES